MGRIQRFRAALRDAVAEDRTAKDGAKVRTAGLAVVRLRPATASGETGVADIVVWPRTFG